MPASRKHSDAGDRREAQKVSDDLVSAPKSGKRAADTLKPLG